MTRTVYNDFISALSEAEWMKNLRREALERSLGMAWPTRADEEFRRSDVSSYDFDSLAFETEPDRGAEVENPVGLSGTMVFEGSSMVRFSLSEEARKAGVIFTSLQAILDSDDPTGDTAVSEQRAFKATAALEKTLRKGLENADNRISVSHYASITHGAFLYVPKFVELKDPFMVTFEESGGDLLRVPQVVVYTEEGARVDVVQRSLGDGGGEVIFNEAVDVTVGDGAQVRYFAMQDVNFDSSCFSVGLGTLGRDARFEHYQSLFGGMFGKYRIDAELNGPGGDTFLGGLYFPTEDQHFDMRTVQRHVADHAHSDALYRGAVSDEAHSVYQGLIHVYHDAVQTDAYLTNNNLVLSDEAQSDSLPTLEIQTDDVRCSHGSTTGKLDEDQIFYLETRGYSPEEARKMLVSGYFEAILNRYPEAVTDEIHRILDHRVTGNGAG